MAQKLLGQILLERAAGAVTIDAIEQALITQAKERKEGGKEGERIGEILVRMRVATEEEVLEYTGAFMQLYREDARYLERTAPWIERVGLDFVKDALADDVARRAFAERFLHSQTFFQDDPWAERARGAQAHEFRPLTRAMAAE